MNSGKERKGKEGKQGKEGKEKEKFVVFDLDETIGFFSQLYFIWDLLMKMSKTRLSLKDFFVLCEMFSCYFHPEIIDIMVYLREKNINPVIFTNNQAPVWWPKLITLYINYKTNKLLNKGGDRDENRDEDRDGDKNKDKNKDFIKEIVGAYTINGYISERRRTSNSKKYTDLYRILDPSSSHKILFLDDKEHVAMRVNAVKYIKVPVYIMMLPPQTIASVFLRTYYGKLFLIKNRISVQTFIKNVFFTMTKNKYAPKKNYYNYVNINLKNKIQNFVEK